MAKRRQRAAAPPSAASAPTVAWPAVALVSAALLPLVGTFGAQLPVEAVDLVAAFIALAALVGVVALVRSRSLIQPTRLTGAWTAFLVLGFVSLVVSGRPWTAFMGEATALTGWAALAAATAIAWAAGELSAPTARLLRRLALWVVLFECLFALGQLFVGLGPAGTLPNSTYLGETVLLLLPWVLASAEAVRGRDLQLRIAVVLIAVGTLAAAGSRTAAVLGLAWAVWTFSRLDVVPAAIRRWVGVAAVAVVVASGLFFARSEVLGSAGVATLGARPAMWALGARAVAERPLLGWGPDGFVAGGSSAMTPELAQKGLKLVFRFGTTDPHNLLVFLAVSTGIAGLALFAWFAVEVGLRWRRLTRARLGTAPAMWAVALTFGILLTAPVAPHVIPLLAVMVGLSVSPLAKRQLEGAWQRPVAVVAAVLLGVVSLAFGGNAVARLPYERYGADVSPGKASAAASASQRWSFDPHLAYLASLNLGYAVQQDRALAAQQPDLAAVERAARLDRRNPFYALEYARTLGFYGSEPARVDAAFRETLRRYPGFPAARAEYGLFLAERGQEREARKQLEIARLVDEGDPEVARAITAAEKALGD